MFKVISVYKLADNRYIYIRLNEIAQRNGEEKYFYWITL